MEITKILRGEHDISLSTVQYSGFETFKSAVMQNGHLYISSEDSGGKIYDIRPDHGWPLFDDAPFFYFQGETVVEIKQLLNKLLVKTYDGSRYTLWRVETDWSEPVQIYQANEMEIGIS